MATSNLSRKVESRNNKRPYKTDMGENYSFAQEADVLISLYRDDFYNFPPDAKQTKETEVSISLLN